MPRKKTVQPLPLEELILDDGTIIDLRHEEYIEVRDETCQKIGKGMHNHYPFLKKRDEVLLMVGNDYLTPEGRKKILPENDYLSNPTKFWRKIVCTGGMAASGADDSTVRRRLYKDIKQIISQLEKGIKNRGKPSGTS